MLILIWCQGNVLQIEREFQFTSSSDLSARAFSPSASCFCSAARARDRRTSSSFERMTHSKCRSRSSYCLRTSFSRSRTLESQLSGQASKNRRVRTRHRICLLMIAELYSQSQWIERANYRNSLMGIICPVLPESLTTRLWQFVLYCIRLHLSFYRDSCHYSPSHPTQVLR